MTIDPSGVYLGRKKSSTTKLISLQCQEVKFTFKNLMNSKSAAKYAQLCTGWGIIIYKGINYCWVLAANLIKDM